MKDIEIMTPLEAMARASTITDELKKDPFEIAKKQMEIGILVNSSGDLTVEEIANHLGMSYRLLSKYKAIANLCDNDINVFINKYRENNAFNIDDLYRKIRNKKTGFASMDKKLQVNIKYFQKSIRIWERVLTPEYRRNLLATVKLGEMIRHKLPTPAKTFDMLFIKYHECCCCGNDEVPEDGWRLAKLKKDDHILYPVCETCFEEHIEPDMYSIAKMYYMYAQEVEEAFDKIR